MLKNATKIAAITVSLVSLASVAAADLIAGWDFSQYKADGELDDGSGFVDTLPANYSYLDVTFGAGGTDPGDSADYGTMYVDGTFGSSNVPTSTSFIVPRANDTKANRKAPSDVAGGGVGINVFDAFNVLLGEGQTHQSRTALAASATSDVVFQADQAGSVKSGPWSVSFAGWAEDVVGVVNADVEFATDCSSYVPIQTVVLTEEEQAFNVTLSGSITAADGCVRLRLDATNGQPVIDNVAIAVPEAGATAMGLAGVLTVLGLKRRRRA